MHPFFSYPRSRLSQQLLLYAGFHCNYIYVYEITQNSKRRRHHYTSCCIWIIRFGTFEKVDKHRWGFRRIFVFLMFGNRYNDIFVKSQISYAISLFWMTGANIKEIFSDQLYIDWSLWAGMKLGDSIKQAIGVFSFRVDFAAEIEKAVMNLDLATFSTCIQSMNMARRFSILWKMA